MVDYHHHLLCSVLQNYRPYRDRAFPGGGKNQGPGNHTPWRRHTRNNGLVTPPQELTHDNGLSTPSQQSTSPVECQNELSQAEYPVLRNGKTVLSDYQSQMAHTNAYSHPPEKFERGSSCPKTWPSQFPDGVRRSEADVKHTWEPAVSPLDVAVQSCEPLMCTNHER